MAKSPSAPDFLRAEPANTPVFIHAERSEELCLGGTELSKSAVAFLGECNSSQAPPFRRRFQLFYTVFEAFATGWDSFPRRFSRKAANIALARAGNNRCIRSMR